MNTLILWIDVRNDSYVCTDCLMEILDKVDRDYIDNEEESYYERAILYKATKCRVCAIEKMAMIDVIEELHNSNFDGKRAKLIYENNDRDDAFRANIEQMNFYGKLVATIGRAILNKDKYFRITF